MLDLLPGAESLFDGISQKSHWVSGCHTFSPLRVYLYYLPTPSPEFFLSELTHGLLPSCLLLPPAMFSSAGLHLLTSRSLVHFEPTPD